MLLDQHNSKLVLQNLPFNPQKEVVLTLFKTDKTKLHFAANGPLQKITADPNSAV